jgi:membrane protease YdiL (CAAX protease family)
VTATALVIGAGVLAEAVAWWLIAARGFGIWVTMAPVLVGLGVVALVTGEPTLSVHVTAQTAAAVGFAAGLALYLATRAFMAVVGSRWRFFREQSTAMYAQRTGLSLAAALLLSAALMVVGEELFYRGLLQPELQDAAGEVGLVLAWLVFVAANLPSLNAAIVAGATVGGVVWVALAWWSGGMLASLVCHASWTALMLAFPVVARSPARSPA